MPDGGSLRVTATPARHGPPGGDRGPVVGFVLQTVPGHGPAIYVSGDTVWFEGVSEVAERFEVDLVLLFAGAARVREVGPAHLTFTAEEAVQAARVFGTAAIVPLHFEGWTHFSESRADLVRAFSAAGLESRLLWPAAGHAIALPF
jgi:L-ascorbate metabolism protein UlaG (beta-lactamase superfamily)